jgi:Family of unknown function (DUF5947)
VESAGAFSGLQGLLKKKAPAPPGERCDFCVVPIGPAHGHLIDLQARRIMCACRPCYLVMEPQGAAQGRYKAVPMRYVEVPELAVGAQEWEALQIPIALAFFFFNSREGKMVAFYPGPAGATESLLPLETWDEIAARAPLFATLQPDVEAILIHRRAEGTRCFIVPIDAAYELVGVIRTTWRGFAGGDDAWERIDAFFTTLRARSEGRVTEPIS